MPTSSPAALLGSLPLCSAPVLAAPTADVVCCLASSNRFWCTGSLTLAHEYTPTAHLCDCWLGLLRGPWHASHQPQGVPIRTLAANRGAGRQRPCWDVAASCLVLPAGLQTCPYVSRRLGGLGKQPRCPCWSMWLNTGDTPRGRSPRFQPGPWNFRTLATLISRQISNTIRVTARNRT